MSADNLEDQTLTAQADEPMIDSFDLVFLLVAGIVAILYLYKDTLFGNNSKPAQPAVPAPTAPKPATGPPKKNKNFLMRMKETDKNVILFYGSQTGTAEDYASRLAKEGQQRYGLKTMTVDVEDCDMTLLDKFPSDCIAFFLMATYGEGEPTDDAVDFWDLITSEFPGFSEGASIEEKPLSSLRYVVFALGNKTYEHFNAVGRMIDRKLTEFGSTRIGECGEGDDDGSLEEDFLGWKEDMWKAVCEAMQIDQNDVGAGAGDHIASYKITELEIYDSNKIYYGEHSEALMVNGTRPTYDAKNPYLSPIVATRELFNPDLVDRNCIHMELDISGSGIDYETGDHVAVWPMNAEQDVEKLLKVLGLWEKRDTIISVENTDPSASKKNPFPVPTTYATIFRHYVDIHTPTSRQFIATLANFAPTEEGKSKLTSLGLDKEAYRVGVSDAFLTLGEVLESISPDGKPLDSIPLDLIIETLPRLQPRYYSISSSSKRTPKTIHITATVLTFHPTTAPEKKVYGVATNYLLQVHRKLRDILHPETSPTYLYSGPRNRLHDEGTNTVKFPVHVRRTNFKLPKSSTPIVMVGPGTGVAPFRGFIIERSLCKAQGEEVGDTILFFGCRRRDEDFLYESELNELFSTLGESGKLITAFSREQAQKVYVQHRIMENASYLWHLIYDMNGYFYVCGDAKNMARDVNTALIQIAQSHGGMDENSATNYVKSLRSEGRYQEDVWS